MNINLTRPLLFFDIESTGLNIPTDCIAELSFVKLFPGREEPEVKTWRILPWDYLNGTIYRNGAVHPNGHQHPMDASASAVNGIKDEDLRNEKTFFELSDEIASWVRDCDFAGYNSAKFDLPMLAEEFERVKAAGKNIDLDLHEPLMVDVQSIFHTFEPRNLKAAYRFYCGGQDFDNAHSALADTMATYEVLKGQLDRYQTTDNATKEILVNNVQNLARYCKKKNLDFSGSIIYNDKGEETISFGKHKGKTAREVYDSDPGYYSWIQTAGFTRDTKGCFARLAARFKEEDKKANYEAMHREPSTEELNSLADLFNNRLG